jgi:RNA 2',3'-cyclic 3'-phosphodiesterase
MPVIRAFIAIELPVEVQQGLDQVIYQLRQRLQTVPASAVRWVSTGNIHLTLKFLGDVSLAHLDMLKDNLLTEVKTHPSFEFSVGGAGAFPNARQPRVVWVSVQAPPELLTLQSAIECKMGKLGYSREERPFSPHLTLGRVSRNATNQEAHQIGQALQAIKVGFLGLVNAQGVSLFKSDLQPTGSVYTCLLSAPLSEQKI